MGAGVGKDVGGVVDGIRSSAQFSDSRTIRRIAKDTQKTFKSWEPVTDQGKAYAKIAGHRIDFANALDLLELSVDLMFLADLRHERSKWLAEFEAGADGYAIFDAQQAAASRIVQLETENDWLRRSELVLQFVRDKVVDLGVAGLKDGLALKWVKWATDEVGLRGFAHGVASAASTVFVGISISNLLLGLDDLVDSMKIAEREHVASLLLQRAAECADRRRQGPCERPDHHRRRCSRSLSCCLHARKPRGGTDVALVC